MSWVKFEKKLPRTLKLFHRDPYATGCEATVLWTRDNLVVTDRSVFYAESGGQDFDTGSIEGVSVVDVQDQSGRMLYAEREGIDVPAVQVDTVIVHTLDRPSPFAPGETVRMHIDWPRRYRLMRYHCATHFLFHAVEEVLAASGQTPFVKGCHIRVDGSRLDYGNAIEAAPVEDIQTIANELIAEGLAVEMEPEPASDEIFYWRYKHIVIPCGGTHVRGADELEPLRVRRSKKGKSVTRLSCRFESES